MKVDTQFDEKLLRISDLKWLPWVGCNYNNSRCKILVVGDSHYDHKDGRPWNKYLNYTRRCVYEQHFDNSWLSPTHDILNRILTNDLANPSINIWNNICFHNLVLELLDTSSTKPSTKQLVEGWPKLAEIVAVLEPTLILCFSARGGENQIIRNLNNNGVSICKKPKNEWEVKLLPVGLFGQKGTLTKGGRNIDMLFLPHPNSVLKSTQGYKTIDTLGLRRELNKLEEYKSRVKFRELNSRIHKYEAEGWEEVYEATLEWNKKLKAEFPKDFDDINRAP